MWRVCAANQWWSAFGKKRGRNGKRPDPPAHDDLVERKFGAEAPDALWLTDITEHPTGEGKLYLCAVKDVWSNPIVGWVLAVSDGSAKGVPRVADDAADVIAGLPGPAGLVEKPGRVTAGLPKLANQAGEAISAERTVVKGRNMVKRVVPYAEKNGYGWYKGTPNWVLRNVIEKASP